MRCIIHAAFHGPRGTPAIIGHRSQVPILRPSSLVPGRIYEVCLSHPSLQIRQHWRRNWMAFLGDYLGFGIGVMFASTTTTLPAFAATLTDSKVLIGAVSSVWAGGWLLPQIFAAHYLSDKPHKYPIMMKWQLIGRPAFPLFVVWLI